MRFSYFACTGTILAFSLAGTSHTSAAPADTRPAGPTTGCSYTPPTGWKVTTVPGQKYNVCYGPRAKGFTPTLLETVQVNSDSLEKFTQTSITGMSKQIKRFHVVSQSSFVTASGLHGIRLASIGMPENLSLYQIYYIFPNSGSEKVAAVLTCLEADGPKYAPATDKAMKTFKLQ